MLMFQKHERSDSIKLSSTTSQPIEHAVVMAEDNSENEGNEIHSIPVTKEPAKKLPPESPESIRLRTLVITSFWVVVILLGLPVWLWTTSIHRARLPLQDMLDWAHGKVCLAPLLAASTTDENSTRPANLQSLYKLRSRLRRCPSLRPRISFA